MSRPFAIVGTGGFAIELCAVVRAAGLRVLGFIGPQAEVPLPAPYLGADDLLDSVGPDTDVLVAIGDPSVRKRLCELVLIKKSSLASFVSPNAFVAADVVIGAGTIVYPNATVHTRVNLGFGVLVNSNATVGHETRIGDYSTIGPGACLGGRCDIGANVYLGVGCTMLERRRIAPGTIVGAGAVVVKDIDIPGTYVGIPARPIS